jgi:hypothetical protein
MELNAMARSTTETSAERMELNAMAWARQKLLRERMELNAMAGARQKLYTGESVLWRPEQHSDIVSGDSSTRTSFPEQKTCGSLVKTWWQPEQHSDITGTSTRTSFGDLANCTLAERNAGLNGTLA